MVEEPSHVKQLSPKPRVWSRVKRYYPMSLQFLVKTYKAFFFLFSSWAFQILLHPPTENLFLFTLWKLWCVFLEQHSLFLCWIKLCTQYVHTESCLLSESWKYTLRSNSCVKSRQKFSSLLFTVTSISCLEISISFNSHNLLQFLQFSYCTL
jgi:hypothetical protein